MAQTLFPIREYEEVRRLDPYWSDWTCFCHIIVGRKYLKRPTITKWFNELVDRSEYSETDKSALLGYLFGLAKEKRTEF